MDTLPGTLRQLSVVSRNQVVVYRRGSILVEVRTPAELYTGDDVTTAAHTQLVVEVIDGYRFLESVMASRPVATVEDLARSLAGPLLNSLQSSVRACSFEELYGNAKLREKLRVDAERDLMEVLVSLGLQLAHMPYVDFDTSAWKPAMERSGEVAVNRVAIEADIEAHRQELHKRYGLRESEVDSSERHLELDRREADLEQSRLGVLETRLDSETGEKLLRARAEGKLAEAMDELERKHLLRGSERQGLEHDLALEAQRRQQEAALQAQEGRQALERREVDHRIDLRRRDMEGKLDLARKSREDWKEQQLDLLEIEQQRQVLEEDLACGRQQRDLEARRFEMEHQKEMAKLAHQQEMALIDLLNRSTPEVLISRAKDPQIARALSEALFKDWSVEKIMAVKEPTALAEMARAQSSEAMLELEASFRREQAGDARDHEGRLRQLFGTMLESLGQAALRPSVSFAQIEGRLPGGGGSGSSSDPWTRQQPPAGGPRGGAAGGGVSPCCGAPLPAPGAPCPACGKPTGPDTPPETPSAPDDASS